MEKKEFIIIERFCENPIDYYNVLSIYDLMENHPGMYGTTMAGIAWDKLYIRYKF